MSGTPNMELISMDNIRVKHRIHVHAEHLDATSLEELLQNDPTLVNRRFTDLTPLHIAADSLTLENYDQVFRVIKVLVKYKADINSLASDSSFHTPFSLLVDKLVGSKDARASQLLDFIVDKYDCIDIDNRGGETREILAREFPGILSRVAASKRPGEFDANDKQQVLDKLRYYLDDGTNEEKFASTLDKLEADSRFTSVMKGLLEEGDLLRVAVTEGLPKCVKKLLEMGSKADRKGSGDIQTPIGIACQKGYWEILSLLASVDGIFDETDPLLSIVVKNLEGTRLSESCDYYKCFDLLVDHKKIDINEKDKWNNTALHYAVRYKNEYAIKKLMERRAYLGTANLFDKVSIYNIDPDVLEQYFDSCITTNKKRPGDDQYEITFDYSCLVPSKIGEKELQPIQYMARSKELQHLVQHPLITSFLFLKWIQLSSVFYVNLAACLIYCMALVTFIVAHPDAGSVEALLLQTLIVLGVVYLIIRELFQLMIAPSNYVKNFSNYMEVALIILTGYILNESMNPDQTRTGLQIVGPITIMLVAFELLTLVGSLPVFKFSTHMVMLRTVLMSFLHGLFLYSIILIAFVLAFYILFRPSTTTGPDQDHNNSSTNAEDELNRFINPGISFVKTLVMMTGEFEANDIEFNKNPLSYVFFVGFLFFIAIVVSNLLNGLAVYDIQIIKSKAELNNRLERIKVLVVFENILLGNNRNIFRNFIINFFPSWISINLFPTVLPQHKILIKPNETTANRMYIPWSNANAQNVERGETVPLVKSVDALHCCWLFGKCAGMDKKVIRQTILILDKKEREHKEGVEKQAAKTQMQVMLNILEEIRRDLKNK